MRQDLWLQSAHARTLHQVAVARVQEAPSGGKHVALASDAPQASAVGENSLDAPPQPMQLMTTPGEFSTELCEWTSGPQACFLCYTASALPCFAYGMIREHTQEGTQRGACQMYSCGFAPLVIPYLGLIISSITRVGMSTWARTQFRKKYGLSGDACTGARLAFALPVS